MDKFVTKKKQVTINQMDKKGDHDKAIQQTTFFFFFLRNKHTHRGEREKGSNTKAHYSSTQKPW